MTQSKFIESLTEKGPIVNRHSIPQQVFKVLRDAITNGEILPGERLRERFLAGKMNVSQSSMREALHRLSHLGLVVRNPNRGTCVTKFTNQEVIDQLKLRMLLEGYAIKEAKSRVTSDSIDLLKEKQKAFENAVVSRDFLLENDSDLEFHRAIWRLSGNSALTDCLERICTPLFAFVMIMLKPYEDRLFSLLDPRSHNHIIESLETGSVEEVEEAICKHINAAWYPFLGNVPS